MKKRISIRPMSSLSLLPTSSYLSKDGSLVLKDGLAFSVVRVIDDKEYYELAWCKSKEVSLYSSITIGCNPDFGKVFLFPSRNSIFLDDSNEDCSNLDFIEHARNLLVSAIQDTHQNPFLLSQEELPPFVSGHSYRYNENVNLEPEYQEFLFNVIDTENDLLIRGLSHLLKSAMLKCLSRTFIDTACLELYVALEATLHIILQKLRENGNSNPSNKDASNFLMESFGESRRLDKYYDEYYQDRIKAVHPSSRFGVFKFVPLYVDDLYMLYNDLLRNYEFLISGHPNFYKTFYPKKF